MTTPAAANAVQPILHISDVAKRFGPTVALDGVDMSIARGQVHALIGENGAGKSTLMSVLAGAVRPDRGTITLAGQSYAPRSPLDARRHGVALIHQELSLCPHLTVAENMLLGVESSRRGWIDQKQSRHRAAELLEVFGRTEIHPDTPVGLLPLAARQVVEVCRALAANARVLLMDEPTSAFQRADTECLFALIRRLAASGIAVVYISHFLEEVREIADRYTVLRDGRSVDTGVTAEVTNDHLIARMVGRATVGGHFPRRQRADSNEVVLSVSGLAAPPAVKDATFDVRRGEIFGIFGLIGSGRTELIRALFALDEATSGRIAVRGRLLALGTSTARRLDDGFGYLSEDRKQEGLALPLSVADNLTATRLSAFTRALGWLDLGRQRDGTRSWIERLRIRAVSPDQAAGSLSGGNQQKVAIGRLLHQDATVLLLDEPTRGIDVGSKEQVYDVIAQCAANGKAVVMVSSYLPELFGLCDRLAVMTRGRLSAARPAAAWTAEEVLAAATAGAA